jgi:tetratricopeptide (TPR) repeat protein
MIVGLVLLGCVGPTGVHELEWLEVRTQHFVVWSALGEEQTLALARDLELFRALVERTANAAPAAQAPPVSIYAFPSAWTYRHFGPDGSIGFFEEDMRGHHMAIQGGTRVDEAEILKHEYVHYVLASGELSYPRWYHEGFAEFLATAQVEGDQVEVGAPPEGAAYAQGWIGLDRLLDPSFEPEGMWRVWAFYTQAWALVHYLHFAWEGKPIGTSLGAYLRETGSGAPVDEAVEIAFGLPLPEFDREVERYLEDRRFRYVKGRLEDLDVDASASVEAVAAGRMALELGRLSLQTGRPEQARSYFESARGLDSNRAPALAGVGVAAHQLGDPETARARLEQALAEDPDDPRIHLDYARYLHERAEGIRTGDRIGERDALIGGARRHYVRSWKLDDSVPETYAMYGASFLLEGQDAAAGIESLEHAHRLLPSNAEIRLLLSEAYAAVGRYGPARDLAASVLGWSHDAESRVRASELLGRIDELSMSAATDSDPTR